MRARSEADVTRPYAPTGVRAARFARGDTMVFERDATGRVVGYVQSIPDGSIIRATRIR